MADAPWWGVPLVSGMFAFVGVLLAQTVTLYTDRRKSRREDQRRWHAERKVVYATFFRKVSDMLMDLALMSEQELRVVDPDSASRGELRSVYDELLLLASEKVSNRAQGAYRAVVAIVSICAELSPTQLESMLGNAEDELASFLVDARIELGISKPERRYNIAADSVGSVLWRSMRIAIQALTR